MPLKIGSRYGHTYAPFVMSDHRVIPASTVYFTVEAINGRIVDILFDNGARNKFSVGSPMHDNCFPA